MGKFQTCMLIKSYPKDTFKFLMSFAWYCPVPARAVIGSLISQQERLTVFTRENLRGRGIGPPHCHTNAVCNHFGGGRFCPECQWLLFPVNDHSCLIFLGHPTPQISEWLFCLVPSFLWWVQNTSLISTLFHFVLWMFLQGNSLVKVTDSKVMMLQSWNYPCDSPRSWTFPSFLRLWDSSCSHPKVDSPLFQWKDLGALGHFHCVFVPRTSKLTKLGDKSTYQVCACVYSCVYKHFSCICPRSKYTILSCTS